jgi:hypothetical protein
MSTVVCALLSQTKRTPPVVGLVAALVGLVAGVHAAAAGAAANLTEPPEPPEAPEAPEAREAPEAAPSLVAADATAAAPAFSGERELLALTAFARAVELDLALALFFPLTLPDEGADNILLRRSREIEGDRGRSREIEGDQGSRQHRPRGDDGNRSIRHSREIKGDQWPKGDDGNRWCAEAISVPSLLARRWSRRSCISAEAVRESSVVAAIAAASSINFTSSTLAATAPM